MSFNGDNLHGPKGTGALFIRSGIRLSPFILGGHDQAGLRAGALNVPGLVGLGIAARELAESQDLMCTEIARLRGKLEMGIQAACPEAIVFYQDEERLPNCSAIAFPGITNDALLFALNRRGIFACFGGGNFQKISLLLTAAGVEETLANSAVNFSLSRDTTEEDIDHALEVIISTVKQLRKLSAHLIQEQRK
jgi:cysteine desulfurase